MEKGQLVQHLLGRQFLDRTDQCIGDHHRKKRQIVIAPGNDQQDAEHQKDQVEVGQDIFLDDVLRRLLLAAAGSIGKALCRSLPDFLFAQPCNFRFIHVTNDSGKRG